MTSRKQTSSPDKEIQKPNQAETPENHSQSPLEPESTGSSSALPPAVSEGGALREAREGASGLELSRPGSETYLTASDDSSSVFGDDMQRAERPRLSLLESCDGDMCKDEREGGHPAKLVSGDLNERFQSQTLDSSSSSSEPNTPSPILTPALTPKRPTTPQDPRDNPALPKQPRLRTPASAGSISVSLAKKHLSQPAVSSEATYGQTRNALSMLRPLRPQETDIDQLLEGKETDNNTPHPKKSCTAHKILTCFCPYTPQQIMRRAQRGQTVRPRPPAASLPPPHFTDCPPG